MAASLRRRRVPLLFGCPRPCTTKHSTADSPTSAPQQTTTASAGTPPASRLSAAGSITAAAYRCEFFLLGGWGAWAFVRREGCRGRSHRGELSSNFDWEGWRDTPRYRPPDASSPPGGGGRELGSVNSAADNDLAAASAGDLSARSDGTSATAAPHRLSGNDRYDFDLDHGKDAQAWRECKATAEAAATAAAAAAPAPAPAPAAAGDQDCYCFAIEHAGAFTTVSLKPGQFAYFGRSNDCLLPIGDDLTVSSQHAVISLAPARTKAHKGRAAGPLLVPHVCDRSRNGTGIRSPASSFVRKLVADGLEELHDGTELLIPFNAGYDYDNAQFHHQHRYIVHIPRGQKPVQAAAVYADDHPLPFVHRRRPCHDTMTTTSTRPPAADSVESTLKTHGTVGWSRRPTHIV